MFNLNISIDISPHGLPKNKPTIWGCLKHPQKWCFGDGLWLGLLHDLPSWYTRFYIPYSILISTTLHYWYPYLPHVYYVSTCQVRVSRFYHSCLRLVLPPPGSLGLRPQLRAPDLSGHWPSDLSGHCRTRTAARSQWALPDFNRERQWAPPQPNCEGQILVCTAGPQLQRPDEPV